jgi:phosphoglycerol transferase MdoB-like AlkP superfamily enzyme
MAYFGNTQNLTPFFDSLAMQSWFFNRCYSAGVHTFNGVYSTLFSHPALMQKHPMKHVKTSLMAGFSNTLFAQYHTIFFTTHDEQFDNMSGFLLGNGFQTIVGQKDYPKSEIRSNLGVPDYFMFRHAIPHLREFHESGKPFFATLLTSSDHTPCLIPKDTPFKPRSTDIHQQTTEFADWSLEQFMAMAKAEPWYANTVFVFVADHGSAKGILRYDIVLSYHHIPLVIYYDGITPEVFTTLALQEDIFPTVMSRMGIPYINNTFGIDLLRRQRQYAIFATDDKVACMSDSLLYIYRTNSADGIYRYDAGRTDNEAASYPDELQIMLNLCFSLLQTSQDMIENNETKTSVPLL